MGRDDDDRLRDGEGGPVDDDPFSLADIVVPDDARELAADLRALQRERRAGTRQRWFSRLLPTRRRRYGLSGPIVVGVLVLVTGFASLMLLFQPRRMAARPAPLATGVRGTGQEGGLVPDLALHRSTGETVAIRDYRPAVLAVVPKSCGCDSLLQVFGIAALRHHLAFVLVGSDVPGLPAELVDHSVIRASEPTGQLVAAYRVGRQPVLLLVRGDGVVNRLLTTTASPSALDGELAVLVATGSVGPQH